MIKLKKFLLYWRVHAVKREFFCLKIQKKCTKSKIKNCATGKNSQKLLTKQRNGTIM